MTIIQLPTGENAEFPDDMPLDQIKAVLQKKFPANNNNTTNNRSFIEKSGDFVQSNFNDPIEQNLVYPAMDFTSGLEQGLVNILPGVANLGINGINALTNKIHPRNISNLLVDKNPYAIPNVPYAKFAPNNPNAKAGEFASFFIPGENAINLLGKVPELANAANAANKIPFIANAMTRAGNILSKSPLMSRVAGNAILGGAMNPDDEISGMILGGAAPIAGKAIGKGLELGINAIKGLNLARLFRGNLTEEQLARNLDAARGTESDLGGVVGSPGLKRFYENYLSKIPFSGGYDTLQRTGGQIIQKGHDILNNLIGDNKGEYFSQILNETLQKAFNTHRSIKNQIYDYVNDLGDTLKFSLNLPQFTNKAQDYWNVLTNMDLLNKEPELRKVLSRLQNYLGPNKAIDETGNIIDKSVSPSNSLEKPTLKEANLLKGRLGDLAERYGSSTLASDRHMAGIFGDLTKSLRSDIRDEIDKFGNKELKRTYKLAEDNYKNNFSPFLDREIYKFANGNADTDTLLQSFIKTGKANDRANLIDKLIEKLPSDKKNLLGYGYLTRALDENNVLNPLKMKTLLSRNSLGPRQFKSLFPDESIRNELNKYMNVVQNNTKALKLMENPDTGQMAMDLLPMLGGDKSSLVGKFVAARPLVKYLSNPKTRERVITDMINNDRKGIK